MTDEYARLTPVFWALLRATAVATGLLGSALMLLLTTVEHLAFGYDSGTLEDGAEHASAARRRLLVACGGGAGFAAVCNVPLGGALFTAEILLGSMELPVVLPALACSGVATAVGGVFLGNAPTYTGVPDYPFLPAELAWAVVAGAVIGLLAVGLVRMIGLVSHHRPRGRWPSSRRWAPMTVAVVLATAVARRLDGYSIYSARLSANQSTISA